MVLTCTTRAVIERLLAFHSFRKLFFITKHSEFCTVVEKFSSRVVCIQEDAVLPGVSYDLLNKRGANIRSFQGIGNRVGWYYAMFLKIGVGKFLDDLSDYYVVWDSDNIPSAPLNFLTPDNRLNFCANPLGANRPATYDPKGYGYMHHLTTGLRLIRPNKTGALQPDHANNMFNFVCGYIVGYRPYVVELISHMEWYIQKTQPDLPANSMRYPFNIFYLANKKFKQELYWADYDTYPSWVANMHPDAYAADFTISYTRNPSVVVSDASKSK
eukprot:gene22977-27792_t